MAKRRAPGDSDRQNRARRDPRINGATGLGVNHQDKFVWQPGDLDIDANTVSVPKRLGHIVKGVAKIDLSDQAGQKKLGAYLKSVIGKNGVSPNDIIWLIQADAFGWTNPDLNVVIE